MKARILEREIQFDDQSAASVDLPRTDDGRPSLTSGEAL
jgi:hypothetical protein